MSDTERITPDDIRQACRQTLLKLVRRRFGDGEFCGCPATVLCKARAPQVMARDDVNLDCDDNVVEQWLFETYGQDYGMGFIHGFDATPGLERDKQRYRQGFHDGAQVRDALWSEEALWRDLRTTHDHGRGPQPVAEEIA